MPHSSEVIFYQQSKFILSIIKSKLHLKLGLMSVEHLPVTGNVGAVGNFRK